MNNKYKITVEAPLIRAGVKIETECSEKYVVKVMEKLMDIIREINTPKSENNEIYLNYTINHNTQLLC